MRANTIGPSAEEALGLVPAITGPSNAYHAYSPNPIPVPKGHSKDASADPSNFSAQRRAVSFERTGARYRVMMPTGGPPNEPYSAATTANGRVVGSAAPVVDKNYAAGTNYDFYDGPVTGY